MLVLSRKVNERIRIGDGIFITLVRVGKNNARIGIEAPAGVAVLRDELYGQAPTNPSGPLANRGRQLGDGPTGVQGQSVD